MKKILAVVGAVITLGTLYVGWVAAPHVLPLSWTGEASRLAAIIGARAGSRIAEIGAGNGAMARELATVVGGQGRVLVTELSQDKRDRLHALVLSEQLPQITVIEAGERATNLPSACCSAVFMRNVLHHIDDWDSYARDLFRTVEPAGVVAVIDFAPGAFFHLAGDHGADPARVIRAFEQAGLRLSHREDRWTGSMYLLAFRRPPSGLSRHGVGGIIPGHVQ